MRLPVLFGVLWFAVCAALSYRQFTRYAPPTIRIERGALPVPARAPREVPPAPRPSLDAPPVEPYESDPEPSPIEGPEVVRPVRETPPRTILTSPASPEPPPAESPAPHPQPEPEPAPPPDAVTGELVGVCLTCGAPTDSWVEVDGRRQGYCRKHVSKVKIPLPRHERPRAAPEPAGERAPRSRSRAASEPGSVQCVGRTRSGGRCRRKTRDPSGLCYQHRR